MGGHPMGIDEFSFVYSTALAVLAVGVVALVFGQCLMMGRVGRHWWQGLIPGYNLYLLFCGARLQVLFLAYLACGVACYGFWLREEPEVQDLIWIPIALGVLIIMYVSLALAQRMHLGIGWQVAAFLVPSYAWVLIGLTGVRVDEGWFPWTVRPFVRLEHLIFRKRPWEFDPKTGKPFGAEDEGARADELDLGDELADEPFEEEAFEAEGFEEEGFEAGDFPEEEAPSDFENEAAPAEDETAEWPTIEAPPRGRRLRRHHTMAMPPVQGVESRAAETTSVPLGEDAGKDAPHEAPASPETEVQDMSETTHEPKKHEAQPAGEPAFEGAEFDPVGDEEAEVAAERGADREIENFVDHEAELADAAEAEGGVQDDDLSDEVNSRLEGIYAEELGFPGVTQAVDDEEAVYMESDAALAREEILAEEHDEPDPTGYQARHLASVAEEFEAEEEARKAAEDAEFEKEKASYEAKHVKAKPEPRHAAPPKGE